MKTCSVRPLTHNPKTMVATAILACIAMSLSLPAMASPKQVVENQKSETELGQSKEKLAGIRSLIEKSDFQSAFVSMMEYLKSDKQNLALISAQGLEQATLGTSGATTVFDLTTSALQTNIGGDTLRAHSLGRAAANLLNLDPESALNKFCKAKLIAAMPDVITTDSAIDAVNLSKPKDQL